MTTIDAISVAKVLDALSDDAVEVEVVTKNGYGRSSFPVQGDAINIAKDAVPKLIGKDSSRQAEIDNFLREIFSDSNLSMAFSIAIAKAAAASYDLPLCRYLGGAFSQAMPYPILRVFRTDVDYYVIAIGARSVGNATAISKHINRQFKQLNISNESDDFDVLNNLTAIINDAVMKFQVDIRLGIDFNASSYFEDRRYFRVPEVVSSENQLDYVLHLINLFKLYYVEDPFARDDYNAFADLRQKVGERCIICGDSLFNANKERIKQGVKTRAAKAIIIKPTETISTVKDIVEFSRLRGYYCIIATETSTTCEPSLSHIAVALAVPFIQMSLSGADSTSKLNELIKIEQEIFAELKYTAMNQLTKTEVN